MVEIMDAILSIDFSESKNHGLELWFLDCPEGVVLVDTGMGDEVLGLVEAELGSMRKGWGDVKAVLITHRHGDYVRNLARVKELTGAPVYCQSEEVPAIKEQTGVEPQGLAHEASLPLCGGIEVIHVPGHTEGNCSYLLKELRTLIAGDTIFGDEDGSINEPPEKYCLDAAQATRELERLLAYDFDAFIYTHGKDILTDAKAEVEVLVERTR
jgi:glyoxylase-like metal-dependent hydrolase (beta-lactamase superfamily II)